MAKRFLECSLDQPYLLPPSIQDWLPEEHLARFIADVADQLDLSSIYAAYARKDGRGMAAYHPLMMTRVLLYAYAIGIRSSRAIEKASHDDVAFRYLSANQHPDHDTIANFRQQHLEALGKLFAQALQLCHRAGLVKLGVLAIDGTKVQSDAEYNGGPGYPQFLTFNRSFSYDNANRLISASDSGGWSRNFAYDQYGNMWVTGAQGVGMSGNMPTMNVFNGKNQINYLSYDAAGNLLSVNGNTVTYDAENRMKSAYDNVTHNTETYLYDGIGQRVEKSGPGGTAVYVYDAFGQLAAEYSTAPSTPPCTTCYPSYDHLGSVRLVTDQNGNVVARHDYLPFGEEVPANTTGRNGQWGLTTDTEQKFTGQIRDNETGMDYFHARYFTNALGRFNSPDPANAGADPLDPQSWNGYSYVGNNPLNATDPSGLFKEKHPNAPPVLYPIYWYYMNSLEDWLFSIIEDSEQKSDNTSTGGGTSPSRPKRPSTGSQAKKSTCPTSSVSLDSYLLSKRSPMFEQGANFIHTGEKYNLDPRLLISISGAETSFGRNITAGRYNAFNVLYNGLNSPFSSWRSAINSVGYSLTNPRNGYDLTNTTTMYRTYCQTGATCAAGLKNINTFMRQQLANINALRFPCRIQ